MSLYPPKKLAPQQYTTEFDILKSSLKFLRSDDAAAGAPSWNAQLAKKYEDTLFKEFAVCDLKHYKSGNIALRWRTEDEVLAGTGETSCGNTRCHHHGGDGGGDGSPPADADADAQASAGPAHDPDPDPDHKGRPRRLRSRAPRLTTLELPFAYTEQGETAPRQAMVKVVLCARCVKKLMWKREKEREKEREDTAGRGEDGARRARGEGSRAAPESRARGQQDRGRSTSPRRRHKRRNDVPRP